MVSETETLRGEIIGIKQMSNPTNPTNIKIEEIVSNGLSVQFVIPKNIRDHINTELFNESLEVLRKIPGVEDFKIEPLLRLLTSSLFTRSVTVIGSTLWKSDEIKKIQTEIERLLREAMSPNHAEVKIELKTQ